MSWLNVTLNESISNFKGQLSTLASTVLAEESEDSGSDKEKIGELQSLVQNQESEIKRLQHENNEIIKRIAANESNVDKNDESPNWSWECSDSNTSSSTNLDWKLKIQELENEKTELVLSLEQLDQDCQQTTDRLVTMKDQLQSENSTLKLQLQDLSKENQLLIKSREADNKRIKHLENITQDKKSDNTVSLSEYTKLQLVLKEYETTINSYQKELQSLKNKSPECIDGNSGDSSVSEVQHKKYVDILHDAIRICVDCDLPAGESSDDPLKYYTKTVENVAKIVMEYRWKCETLDRQLLELSDEKTKLLNSKNEEIEKLLANSEELSANVIQKTKLIKEYEQECADISHNNELLLAKLKEYEEIANKLQTIPETNEHLEMQLDKCHKRIEELEQTLTTKNQDAQVVDDLQDLLNANVRELEEAKGTSQCLSSEYGQLKNENDALKKELLLIRDHYNVCCHQNEDLVDQIQNENENSATQSINIETLKEEIETLANNIDTLTFENNKLAGINIEIERKLEVAENEVTILKQELTAEIDSSGKKDLQILDSNRKLMELEDSVTKLNEEVLQITDENKALVNAKNRYLDTFTDIKRDVDRLLISYQELRDSKDMNRNIQEIMKEKNELLEKLNSMDNILEEKRAIQENIEVLENTLKSLENEKQIAWTKCENYEEKIAELEKQVVELITSRNEVIQLVQAKHQESVNYHEEIKKLQSLLNMETEKSKIFESQLQDLNGSISPEDLANKDKEIEKLQDVNTFLREKCTVLTENLLREQENNNKILAEKSSSSEKEITLQKNLDTLREHLIQVEESYMHEVQTASIMNQELKQQLQDVMEKEKNSSTRYTSANIRANQQLETLQTNLQLVANQRDEFKKRVSDMEDQLAKQNAALVNLQAVLTQYQREKERVIMDEKERVRKQIVEEKKKQEDLNQQIADLRSQLEESKQGLKAAVRLSDQVEKWKKQASSCKEEVTKMQRQLEKAEEKYTKMLNQTDGRVDKMLIKNLVIGLINCEKNQSKDKSQIVRIISTVLDFNQQDLEKVELNKSQQANWFSQLLHPSNVETTTSGQTMSQDSLTQAFVKFLEAESGPRNLPNLLEASATVSSVPPITAPDGNKPEAKGVRQSSMMLNEVVLPTFADFGVSRNSSSILKDVLKDQSNS